MQRFTQVDYADHLALVAEVFADGRETVIAEARYVRGPTRRCAEFAVSVAEPGRARGSPACCSASSPAAPSRPASRASSARRWQPTPHDLHLARKAGFTFTPSPDVRGLMLLEKELRYATLQRRRGRAARRLTRAAPEIASVSRPQAIGYLLGSCDARLRTAAPATPARRAQADHDGGDERQTPRPAAPRTDQHRRERPHRQRGER